MSIKVDYDPEDNKFLVMTDTKTRKQVGRMTVEEFEKQQKESLKNVLTEVFGNALTPERAGKIIDDALTEFIEEVHQSGVKFPGSTLFDAFLNQPMSTQERNAVQQTVEAMYLKKKKDLGIE